jgi:adenylate cyclase class IV
MTRRGALREYPATALFERSFSVAQEIEAKIPVSSDQLAELARRLEAQMGPPILDAVLGDLFFDTADASLRLQESGLRIRTVRHGSGDGDGSDDGSDGGTGRRTQGVVTFKGPRQPGRVKNREEIEVAINDAAAAGAILSRLGYHQQIGYEKRRRSWRVEDCRVELDEVPMLGCFVEIEGPDERCVLALRDRLGLGDLPLEPRSYIQMLSEEVARRGLVLRHIPWDFKPPIA